MNEEIDESEFYHQDFTTPSEWEVFIARMEEIVREWRMESRKSTEESTGQWCIKTEKIPFADTEFTLSLFRKSDSQKDFDEENNAMENEYDFVLKDGKCDFPEACISLWYGLEQFIVLSPVGGNSITSESKIKLLLSSANILVGNENLTVPVFVQIREKWQNSYLGVHETDTVRTDFSSVHLRKGPHHAQYLTGLLDIFRTKIMSPALDTIFVSVRLSYNLTEFGCFTWKQEMPDTDSDCFDSTTLCVLPFGVTMDPINTLTLKVMWSHLPSDLVVDSESYTDFNPLEAPKWSLHAKMADQPLSLLSDCFSEFLLLLKNNLTIYDILGDFASNPTSLTESNPLDVLTEPKVPTISTVLKRAARNSLTKNRRAGIAPLSEDVLVPMLYFLFPDADESAMFPYNGNQNETNTEGEKIGDLNLEELCRGFKTCKPDSLVWRLAIILAQALHNLGGSRALAHLWYEFTQEMRYRWEKTISIPGLEPGFPDPRTCLLHQKLQMLNCCIERKSTREASLNSFESAEDASSSDEDDEFFDCSDKVAEDLPKKKPPPPAGRLGKLGDFKLLKTGEQLYIPITQDPVPKTEDQLEEDTDVLLKLGSNAEGSELRAKMMSASLLSDMESFKAANPGAVLEDFIRWYSPRDWIEDEGNDEWGQPKGHLSSRMLISDNTWVQVWETAKPVAANRQKRLFDDTREAEKVLHFLDSRTTSQIVEMLLAVLSHASIFRLLEESEQIKQELPEAATSLRHLAKTAEKLSRDTAINVKRYENLSQEMAAVELSISQINSLLYKFNPSGKVDDTLSAPVASLYSGNEIAVEKESKIAKRMLAMFSDAQKLANVVLMEQGVENTVLPPAIEREFVLRANAARPKSYSTKCPQFMRAILLRNEFRLCGAFSQDLTFF